MIEMILPDGSKRQLENPMTVVEFAKSIGSSLGKATVGAIIDGVQVDPSHIIDYRLLQYLKNNFRVRINF